MMSQHVAAILEPNVRARHAAAVASILQREATRYQPPPEAPDVQSEVRELDIQPDLENRPRHPWQCVPCIRVLPGDPPEHAQS